MQILKEGYLTKEGGSRKTWKTRYFVLTNAELSYFKLSSDSVPIDSLVLRQYQSCKAVTDHCETNCFALVPIKTAGRTYFMAATT